MSLLGQHDMPDRNFDVADNSYIVLLEFVSALDWRQYDFHTSSWTLLDATQIYRQRDVALQVLTVWL